MVKVSLFPNKGISLIAVIFVMVAFSILGLIGVSLVATTSQESLNTLRSSQALFLAEAGKEYALEFQLAGDDDWSDNADVLDMPLGEGTFDIEYQSQTSNSAIIKFTGKIGDITRKLTVNFTNVPTAFGYAIYAGGHIDTKGAIDLTIIGEQKENATDLPIVDWGYYLSITPSEQVTSTHKTFTAGTYSGIWYVNGNANIESDVIINGTVIATGNINMLKNSNISIIATSPYPALVAKGNFDFKNTENITIKGLIYAGADMTGNFDVKKVKNINFTGTIIVGGNLDLKDSDTVTITYDESMMPPGFGSIITLAAWEETF